MTFTSLTFVFLFLPIAIALYYLLRNTSVKIRQIVLIVLSLIFYAWGDAKSIPIILLSILFNYFAAQEIIGFKRNGSDTKALVAITTITAADVALLACFKYTRLSLPLGMSFYTFSVLSYVFDIYRGRCEEDQSFLNAVTYMIFFPKVVSGPIVEYKDFFAQIETAVFTSNNFLIGTRMFVIGMFKKVILADNFGAAFSTITGLESAAGFTAWLGILFYGIQLYFDFSGYSDMAIGISRILGFKFEKNFDYPYTSMTISEFWRRWHISLGRWFRDYVYIPLGGNRCSMAAQFRNLAIVWLLTGIWHGNTWNFVFWGIWHGFFVVLEKFVIKDRFDHFPEFARVLMTNIIVFIGWIFFFTPSMSASIAYIGKMFGSDGVGMFNTGTLYYLYTSIPLLIIAFICMTPLGDNIQRRFTYSENSRVNLSVSIGVFVVLIFVCISAMVSQTYSSFLYFQF